METGTTLATVDKIIEDPSLAEEELWDELEKEDIPSSIREARLSELKQKTAAYCSLKAAQHGVYKLIEEEKDFLAITTAEEKCVVHFFHADFRRCEIMHSHLEVLAPKHFETKFARMNVEKAKFFANKLRIQVLPAVICFIKGVVVDRIVGFEELSGTDSFPTDVLERRLGRSGVITVSDDVGAKQSQTSVGFKSVKNDDADDTDSENDW